MYQAETAQATEVIGKTTVLRLGTLDTRQYQAVTDLTGLGQPKTGQIDQNQRVAYHEVLDRFKGRYAKRGGGPAYRFGSYRLVPRDENTASVYFGESIINRPEVVDDGGELLKSAAAQSMVVDLAPFVMKLLEDNHYMAYLKSKGLLDPNGKFLVEIAMDFYRDRAGAVGFHKDSLDLTIFVGLMFNNATTINGPEFFYDTTPDQIHQKNVQNKLPAGVLKDVADFRLAKQSDKNIYRSELEPSGWIIFTDETVNHSSPTIDSRAISGKAEKDTLLNELNSVLDQSKLKEVEDYLGSTSFSDGQKFYPEDIMRVVGNPKKDIEIADIFVSKLKKANMSIVQINDCEPQNRETSQPIGNTGRESCTTNLNPQPSKVSPDNKVLERQNSDQKLLAKVLNQPKSDAPRQFIRLWVQVAPKQ